VQGDAGPAGDLVADDHGGESLRPAEVGPRLGKRCQCRHDRDADMALGRAVSIVTVEIVDLRGDRVGGPGHADAPAVKQYARRVLWIVRSVKQRRGIACILPASIGPAAMAMPNVSRRR